MKGGQASPMFPANGKKRGCGFENPEPSSPKVTCIGQVRVKTKKQGKKFRACRSKRRGEVSFRKVDHNNANNGGNGVDASSCQDFNNNMGHLLRSNSRHHQHQQQQQECKKWVHLPLTICEALREFNCFLPCRSSCMANQRDKEGRTTGGSGGNNNGGGNVNGNGNGSSSCGAVFARWLVAVQEGEGGKQREIELVVGGGGGGGGGVIDDDDDYERRDSSEMMMMRSSQRRHVFENIEISDFGNENLGGDEEEEEGRVSICIPPKNALLLMRCRSDPVKMAALANKFWENPVPKDEPEAEAELAENTEEKEEEEEEEEVQEDTVEMVEREERRVKFKPDMEHHQEEVSEVSEMFVSCEATEEIPIPEAEAETEEAESVLVGDETEVVEESLERSLKEETNIECDDPDEEKTNIEEDQQQPAMEEEASLDLEKIQGEEYAPDMEQENEENLAEELQQPPQESAEAEAEEENVGGKLEEEEEEKEVEDHQAVAEEEEKEEVTETTHERSELECLETREPDPEDESKEESESQQNLLPDCLLLMMCEPKLSMEVSKETWVCSTDFIRWTPEKKKQHHQPVLVKQKDGRDEPKRRISIDSNPIHPAPVLLQPRRSSCSFPVAPPMALAAAANAAGGGGGGSNKATLNGKKLVGGKGYEPLLLTRCKSEPRRSSSAKLAQQDACFWKNRKLEPTTLGVGAAGVGF